MLFEFAVVVVLLSLPVQSYFSNARLVDPICLQPPVPGVYPLECCAEIPSFNDHSIVTRCAVKVLDDTDSPMDMAYGLTQEDVLFSPGIRCISECILNETNIAAPADPTARAYSADATLAACGVQDEQYANNATFAAWLPAMRLAIQRCVDIVAGMRFTEPVPNDECDVAAVFYLTCLDTQMFRECPAAVWQSAYGCDQLRQQAAECPVLSAIVLSALHMQ